MVKLLRVLRVILAVLAVVSLYLLISDFCGLVIRDDWRIARAVVAHGDNPSEITQRELDNATSSFRRRRDRDRIRATLVLLSLSAGVVLITRAIHAKSSNHAIQR